MYPYQTKFINWLSKNRQQSDKTIFDNSYAVHNFIEFLKEKYQLQTIVIKQIQTKDIRAYAVYLSEGCHYSARTVNKHLTGLKKYFRFLVNYGYIGHYPLLNVSGISYNRHITYVIGWAKAIPQLITNDTFHPDTIKLLILCSNGADSDNLLSYTWGSIKNHLDNKLVRDFLVKHLKSAKMFNNEPADDTPIFQKSNGKPLKTVATILRHVKNDQNKTNLELLPNKLHLAYVLELVADQSKTDQELMEILHCNKKTLTYYQCCTYDYNLVPFKIS